MSTPLSNKYAFAALRDKRAEIAGKVAALHKEIGKLQRDLAKLDGVIRLFDPSYRVGSIPAKGARQRSNLFKRDGAVEHHDAGGQFTWRVIPAGEYNGQSEAFASGRWPRRYH